MSGGIRGCLRCILFQQRLRLSLKVDECQPLAGGRMSTLLCEFDPCSSRLLVLEVLYDVRL